MGVRWEDTDRAKLEEKVKELEQRVVKLEEKLANHNEKIGELEKGVVRAETLGHLR